MDFYLLLKIWVKINFILSGKYNQNVLDNAKQSATDALKTTSKRVFQKTAKATGNLTGNKIDSACGRCSTNSKIKFKTSMLNSSLCDYSDAYILVSETITVAVLAAGGGNNNIKVLFENCVPFTDFISKINNT